MSNQDVKKIIESEIMREVVVIKRFLGGMSNFTYLIKIGDELFTYRIPGKNSEVFIDRKIEKKNIELIEDLNINCENVYLNTVNGHKMAKFIDGEDLKDYSYEKIADVLRKLHTSNKKAENDYNKIEKLNYYESLLTLKHEPIYFELKKQLVLLEDKYKPASLVLTHGDAQKSNWIIKDEKYYLLDWEFSANNDPFYDIACFGNVDFNEAVKLLNVYLKKEASEEELKRLYYNRFFQCLQWHNVALYKEEIGLSNELQIDFLAVSKKYIALANDFLKKIIG